jgi:hypothetical protein
MLKATRFSNTTSCCVGSSACTCTPGEPQACPAGKGCCDWVADGGCMSLAPPMLNISLGLAAALTDAEGSPIPPHGGPVPAASGLATSLAFDLQPGEEYVLRVACSTQRPGHGGAQRVHGALDEPSALARAVQRATQRNLEPALAAHAVWWEHWWNASAVDLGPGRKLLESFYYGAQYMLGCFARPGGTTAGLLGPWSLQDPVGWSDHLTLDYNVEANYWGAASSNHLSGRGPWSIALHMIMVLLTRSSAILSPLPFG